MQMFKILGLALIFLVSSLFGFLKSLSLKRREAKLLEICKGFSFLVQYIRLGSELKQLLPLCFDENIAKFDGTKPIFESKYLTDKDISIIEDYFEKFGLTDINAETTRAQLYYEMLEKQLISAETQSRNLCRLYNSLGPLGGLFFCIFFL